jgi:hypothetical protein
MKKLSDSTLENLLKPTVEAALGQYGITRYAVKGELDGTGDEAVYVYVDIKTHDAHYETRAEKLRDDVYDMLAPIDGREFFNVYINVADYSYDKSKVLEKYMNLLGGIAAQ